MGDLIMGKNKKGQSAMEYLMTYGWAILVIVVVVGALYAMGVFNPSASTPPQVSSSDFSYTDHDANNLVLRNGPRAIESISLASPAGGTVSPTSASPGDTITITGTGLFTSGTNAIVQYTVTDSGLTKNTTITI